MNDVSTGSESTKHVCTNCWTEKMTHGYLDYPAVANMPPGWGSVMIIRNEGVATNSLACDSCLDAIKDAWASRRDLVKLEKSLSNDKSLAESIQNKIQEAKSNGETTITLEQLGSGKKAVIDISEFEHFDNEE